MKSFLVDGVAPVTGFLNSSGTNSKYYSFGSEFQLLCATFSSGHSSHTRVHTMVPFLQSILFATPLQVDVNRLCAKFSSRDRQKISFGFGFLCL